jgi:hypothetical protein
MKFQAAFYFKTLKFNFFLFLFLFRLSIEWTKNGRQWKQKQVTIHVREKFFFSKWTDENRNGTRKEQNLNLNLKIKKTKERRRDCLRVNFIYMDEGLRRLRPVRAFGRFGPSAGSGLRPVRAFGPKQ